MARWRSTLARESSLPTAGKIGLCRKAALRGVVAIRQMPKEDFGSRLKPTLLDRPIGREMAHGAAAMSALALKARHEPSHRRRKNTPYRWVNRWDLPRAVPANPIRSLRNDLILQRVFVVGRAGLEPATRPL